MTGKELQDAIVDAARRKGFLAAHFHPAQVRGGRWITPVGADGKGWPDLVLLALDGTRLIFAEVKGDGDRLKPEQERWLGLLRQYADALDADHVGDGREPVGVYVWTPADWTSGRIVAALDR